MPLFSPRRAHRQVLALLSCLLVGAVSSQPAVPTTNTDASHSGEARWVAPQGLPSHHNGGYRERLVPPAGGKKPHVVFILLDDFGWASAGWHRNYTIAGLEVPYSREVQTPNMNALVADGMELDRHYVYQFCSPSRSALQTGRNPIHVNNINQDPSISNPDDPVSGFQGIPRNMTGIATKMAAAGYRTALFGKWDVGMATPDHTPHGRGYHKAMSYFQHTNDHWSSSWGVCQRDPEPAPPTPVTDLWHKPEHGPEGPGRGFNNTCSLYNNGLQPVPGNYGQCKVGPSNEGDWWEGYEDSLFEREVLETIADHDPHQPLFLFWSPHIVHAPLQVPWTYYNAFDYINGSDGHGHSRQSYAAMVAFADAAIGNVTRALKAKGMWEDLLLVFSADNGGPIYYNGTSGGNNYPLKGAKMSNFEGGIRANAFVNGGFLAAGQRGRRFEGLVAAWDWYHTFAALAGVDPTDWRAQDAGLPPIDSYDMSDLILGNTDSSPRKAIPIGTPAKQTNLTTGVDCKIYQQQNHDYDAHLGFSDYGVSKFVDTTQDRNCTIVNAVIFDEGNGTIWKLLTGTVAQDIHTGPQFPNASTNFNSEAAQFARQCGDGCLYDLTNDPFEAADLAAWMPARVQQLTAQMEAAQATWFGPQRGPIDPKACQLALGKYRGFWGPWIDVDGDGDAGSAEGEPAHHRRAGHLDPDVAHLATA